MVAEDQLTADMAAQLVNVTYTNTSQPIIDIAGAIAANSFYTNVPGSTFPIVQGDVNSAFAKADVVIQGSARCGIFLMSFVF